MQHDLANGVICRRCGAMRAKEIDRPCPGPQSPRAAAKGVKAAGAGDWVEKQLRRYGITEGRYKAFKAKFGLPPNCSCQARKEWLNRLIKWG